MKDYYMRQCKLERIFNGNIQTCIYWIPENFAYEGHYIRIKRDPNKWKIIKIFGREKKSVIIERSEDYKNTRKASDI